MRNLLFVAVLVTLTSACFGSTQCQSTFSAGSGLTYVRFCVTANGNVAYFESPQMYIHVNGGEGYEICTGVGTGYWDLGVYGDSGNWNPSVITQPKGPNTFPLTITRTSADGWVTLTQSFKFTNSSKAVAITMTLKGATNLRRYVDPLLGASQQLGASVTRSTFMWGGSYGFLAAPAPKPNAGSVLANGGGGEIPCGSNRPPSQPGDLAIVTLWDLTETKNPVTVTYAPIW